ncbi:MAG: hypothetical protein GX923_03190 [Clostridia bacterium]|nr:hypothetical protein [Clostridia bacterium]
MVGLTKNEIIKLLDKYNPGETFDKDQLHEAIAKAIVENNYRVLDDVNAKLKNRFDVFDFLK